MKQGVPIGDVYSTLQAFMGGIYVNDFNRFGAAVEGAASQAEPDFRHDADDMEQLLRAQRDGARWCRSPPFVTRRAPLRPRVHRRFNLYRSAEIIGAAAPGYSSGQALAALEEVAAQTLPPEMGYAWNALSYQEKAAQGGTGKVLRPVAGLRVPDPGGALRELVAAVQRPAQHARGGAGRLPGPPRRGSSTQRLRADRPRHAGRPDGQERHPDRRVRQGAARAKGARSSTPRWRARGCGCARS